MPVLHHWHVGELFTRVGEIETIRGFFMGNIAIAGSNVLFAIIYGNFFINVYFTFIILIIFLL
ncbi:hypothetical protein AT238_01025 [Bartonella henselae]|nr:hypothetical protein AT244_06560 [Bartonella henselae]OLL43519.1 hypothetical protein AT245_01910 [Bartonella henselae]OLL52628.1 hypothetical protein AT238_01025 [Bartonella henselae]